MAEWGFVPPPPPPAGWKENWPPYVSPLEPFLAREASKKLSKYKLIDKPQLHMKPISIRRDPPHIMIERLLDYIDDVIEKALDADEDEDVANMLLIIENNARLARDVFRHDITDMNPEFGVTASKLLKLIDRAQRKNWPKVYLTVISVNDYACDLRTMIDEYSDRPEIRRMYQPSAHPPSTSSNPWDLDDLPPPPPPLDMPYEYDGQDDLPLPPPPPPE